MPFGEAYVEDYEVGVVQIDLGSRLGEDWPHDRAGVDGTGPEHRWWIETMEGERQDFSDPFATAPPAEIAAWVTRRAHEFDSPAAVQARNAGWTPESTPEPMRELIAEVNREAHVLQDRVPEPELADQMTAAGRTIPVIDWGYVTAFGDPTEYPATDYYEDEGEVTRFPEVDRQWAKLLGEVNHSDEEIVRFAAENNRLDQLRDHLDDEGVPYPEALIALDRGGSCPVRRR